MNMTFFAGIGVTCFLFFIIIWQNRTIQHLKKELSCDPLTGLKIMCHFERKCLDAMERIEKERDVSLSVSKDEHVPHRFGKTHTIALVDLDGLKRTNDNPEYGYSVGDQILIALANILDRWKRKDDMIVRRTKGGDEFLLLFAGSSKEEAERLLLENRRRFETVITKNFPGLDGKVSFSFGVREIDLSFDENQLADAFDFAGREMHEWKVTRRMDRNATPSS